MRCIRSIAALLLGSWGLLCAAEPDSCRPPNFPLPEFKPTSFNVRDFGATGNGRDNDTAGINRAIEKCNAAGGGDVTFPSGRYLAASIHLKSNVRLMLDKDAVITGAKAGYDPAEPNSFEKYQDFGHSHFHNALMWGENIENFAIVGGRINGGAIVEDETKDRNAGDKVIALKSSRNLLFENVTHESGGHFVYLLNDCENVTIANVTIKKSRDAVNLVSCRNVQVHNCTFTGCGDDTLALKSDWALGRKILSENIYVWDSYFESACNALVIGAETTGDFRNINFWNIRIGRAWKSGIAIHSADGAVIDGVTYRNITMSSVDTPISITVANRLRTGDPGAKVGAIKNVSISEVTATSQYPRDEGVTRPSLIAGLPDHPVENVSLGHMRIVSRGGGADIEESRNGGKPRRREAALSAGGIFISDARSVALQDVRLLFESSEPRPALVAREVSGLTLESSTLQRFGEAPVMRLEKVDKVRISGCPGISDRTAEDTVSLDQ